MSRNIGTAKMLAIINKILDVGLHHLTEEEMDAYGASQILKCLHEIKSSRAENFSQGLHLCESKKSLAIMLLALKS